jgi:2-oxoglutarate dehydrogenase complex dehydrogenase (E1) component-like enzyme
LIVMTPKSLLRLPAARSRAEEFERGRFHEVMADPADPAPDRIGGVILCTGKVFYDLDAHRRSNDLDRVAILRLEQLYPFPGEQVKDLLAAYPNAQELRWVQEEPDNMGAYRFVYWRKERAMRDGMRFGAVSRPGSGSPATGSATIHEEEQRTLLQLAFEGL